MKKNEATSLSFLRLPSREASPGPFVSFQFICPLTALTAFIQGNTCPLTSGEQSEVT